MAYLYILAAVVDGTAALGLKIDRSGLRSVTIMNGQPYIYLQNILTPNINAKAFFSTYP